LTATISSYIAATLRQTPARRVDYLRRSPLRGPGFTDAPISAMRSSSGESPPKSRETASHGNIRPSTQSTAPGRGAFSAHKQVFNAHRATLQVHSRSPSSSPTISCWNRSPRPSPYTGAHTRSWCRHRQRIQGSMHEIARSSHAIWPSLLNRAPRPRSFAARGAAPTALKFRAHAPTQSRLSEVFRDWRSGAGWLRRRVAIAVCPRPIPRSKSGFPCRP